jgi:ATP phosphoribosyltransferase regulatory subunit
VRADITPQVARIDAHLLNRAGVTRLAYSGSVLHTRPATPAATREPLQIGAEIYGHEGVESDLEVQRLLCRALELCGVRGARMDVGHVAVFRALVDRGRIGSELESELFESLQKKDVPGLRELVAAARGIDRVTREALLLLPELYGGVEVLASAGRRLPKLPKITQALSTLKRLAGVCAIPMSFDLAELRGYHYHSGVVFDAYCDGVTGPVARGGRYDEVGKAFGRSRPATGFSIDLRELAGAAAPVKARERILSPAPNSDAALAKKIAALRAAGEVVVEELPGHEKLRAELGCTRRLAKKAGVWTVQPIKR